MIARLLVLPALLGVLLAPGAIRAGPDVPAWKDYALAAALEGHTSLVRSAAFSPDGKTLVTGGADRSIRLWDPATGKSRALHRLPPSG